MVALSIQHEMNFENLLQTSCLPLRLCRETLPLHNINHSYLQRTLLDECGNLLIRSSDILSKSQLYKPPLHDISSLNDELLSLGA